MADARHPTAVATWEHRPQEPVPTLGGRCWAMPGWTAAGPLDQTEVERRNDVLVFTGEPLVAARDIAGPVRARLWTAAPGLAAGEPFDVCAKLVDVHPDGHATWVADGIVRQRQGETPVGETMPATVELGAACHRFAAGHRLRLEVSASSFPQFDVTRAAGPRRLSYGCEFPSHLELPVACVSAQEGPEAEVRR